MAIIREVYRFSGGEVVTAAPLNLVGDVIEDLAGRNGPVEVEDSVLLTGQATRLRLGGGSRPAVAPQRGFLRWTGSVLEWHDGTTWTGVGNDSVVTAAALIANGSVGTGPAQVARGNHSH